MYKSILLIDDNPLDNYINQFVLENENFCLEILAVQSAGDGLDFLKEKKDPALLPEIIFLDINMPLVDGFGFLEEFAKLSEEINSKSKIIMLSSSLNPRDVERAKADPYVVKFIAKPLTTESLSELVDINNI